MMLILALPVLLLAMPSRPGLNAPEPIYPKGVEVAGPNKLKGFDSSRQSAF